MGCVFSSGGVFGTGFLDQNIISTETAVSGKGQQSDVSLRQVDQDLRLGLQLARTADTAARWIQCLVYVAVFTESISGTDHGGSYKYTVLLSPLAEARVVLCGDHM